MFTVTATEETWGESVPLIKPRNMENYADMKAIICHTIEIAVRDLRKGGIAPRARSLQDVPGCSYTVVLEWCPDGVLLPENWDGESEPLGTGLQCALVIDGCAVNEK